MNITNNVQLPLRHLGSFGFGQKQKRILESILVLFLKETLQLNQVAKNLTKEIRAKLVAMNFITDRFPTVSNH